MTNTKLRVLVLDDEPIVGKRLQPALSKLDCDAEFHEAPLKALQRLDEEVFHVVVTDIRMGDIDGVAVMEHAHGRNPEARVILITGYATVEVTREAMAKGAFEIIAKPFKPQELRDAVKRAAKELGFRGI